MDESIEHRTVCEQLDELFKVALRCGMTPQDYWDGDPSLLTAYYDNYIEEQKQRAADTDWQAWLQGQYFMEALACVIPPLLGGKSTSKYPSEPKLVDIAMDDEAKARYREDKRKAKVLEMHERFKKMASNIKKDT